MLRELIFDDFDPADYAEPTFYNECTGEHYPLRRAGDRYTGLPRGTDPLLKMQATRRHYLSEKAAPPYRDSYQRPSVDDCRRNYELARLVVMRPSSRSRLLQAEMLALATMLQSAVERMGRAA